MSFTGLEKHKVEIFTSHIWKNTEMIQIPQISFAD